MRDPWAWQSFVESVGGGNAPSQRNALKYLAFPSTFEPIVNATHRLRIRDANKHLLSGSPGDIDRDLLEIHTKLQAQSPGKEVDFYAAPWVAAWKASKAAARSTSRAHQQSFWRASPTSPPRWDHTPLSVIWLHDPARSSPCAELDRWEADGNHGRVPDIDAVWERIVRHAGDEFQTVTGLSFAYEVPGNYLLVSRTVRNLSRSNFAKALDLMPAGKPSDLKELQGASYTWAILMDPRIRGSDW